MTTGMTPQRVAEQQALFDKLDDECRSILGIPHKSCHVIFQVTKCSSLVKILSEKRFTFNLSLGSQYVSKLCNCIGTDIQLVIQVIEQNLTCGTHI